MEFGFEARGLGVAEEDEGLLGDVEAGGVDLDLGGRGEPLGAPLAMDPAQTGSQGGGPGGPQEPVALVHRAQDPIELARPALGRLWSVLGRAEGVVGDEDPWAVAIEPAPELVGARALVRLPTLDHPREGDGARDRRLSHLGGGR